MKRRGVVRPCVETTHEPGARVEAVNLFRESKCVPRGNLPAAGLIRTHRTQTYTHRNIHYLRALVLATLVSEGNPDRPAKLVQSSKYALHAQVSVKYNIPTIGGHTKITPRQFHHVAEVLVDRTIFYPEAIV